MKYIATQEIIDHRGIASFLVSPIDGDGHSIRMPAKSIDWTDTAFENEEVEA